MSGWRETARRNWPLVRGVLLTVALGGAAWWVFYHFIAARKLENWLLPRYLGVWVATAVFTLACQGAGLRVMERLWPEWDDRPGRRVLAFASGMLVFFWGFFLIGTLGGLGPLAFVWWPTFLIAWGLRPLVGEVVKAWAFVERHRLSWLDLALAAAAGALFLLVYLPVLNPDNINYDARWYHLGLAEHYAAAGRIVRLPEGPLVGAFPQLATVIYLWAFQAPGLLFDKVELCLCIELVTVVATVASLPSAVRALLPGQGGFRWAFLAYFAFPGIFLYDTAVMGGADHVAAFWVVPAWIALLRGWKKMGLKEAALLAIPLSGLLLTKYTALIAFAPLGAALVIRALWMLGRAVANRSRAQAVQPVRESLVLAGLGLLFTAPHWLKNLVYYGDPIYPMLRHWLHDRPWTPDSEQWHAVYMQSNPNPKGSLIFNLTEALRSLIDYPYNTTYNWDDFHGATPAFGALFTACLVALPFVKGAKRVWLLVAAVHLSIFTWFYVSHLERYLEVVVPWMAVALAAVLALAWRQGGLAVRAGLVLMVTAQLAGQADLPFIPSHRMNGHQAIISRGIDVLSAGYLKDVRERLRVFDYWVRIGELTPTDAYVLVHRGTIRFGIGRRSMSDLLFGGQYGISYAALGTVPAVHQRLKELGVTRLAWNDDQDDIDSIAGELLFRTYAHQYTLHQQKRNGWTVGTPPDTPPGPRGDDVLMLGCGTPYKPGLYRVEDLNVPQPVKVVSWPQLYPREVGAPDDLVKKATYVVVQDECKTKVNLAGFQSLGHRRGPQNVEMWARAPGAAEEPSASPASPPMSPVVPVPPTAP